MKLKDLIEQYGDYEVIDTVDTEIHKGNSKNDGINVYLRKPKPKTVWDLEYEDKYYYIGCNGDVYYTTNVNSFDDEDIIKNGNAFLTKEEAERDAERRKVETILLKHGGRRQFRKDDNNYYLWVNIAGRLIVGYTGVGMQGLIYFDTREQIEKSVQEIGEDRIKKALFEVR